jgi:hypothetical protein
MPISSPYLPTEWIDLERTKLWSSPRAILPGQHYAVNYLDSLSPKLLGRRQNFATFAFSICGRAMWYGFTKQIFLGGLRIFIVIGLSVGILGLCMSIAKGTGIRNWMALIAAFLVVPGVWLALSAIWSATWLKFERDELA